MKLIIAGSRTLSPATSLLRHLVYEHFKLTPLEIVSGASAGVDQAGERWAASECEPIPVRRFPALWKTAGKAAGPIRNAKMADYADALLLIWDGESRGSANMKQQMVLRMKDIYEVILCSRTWSSV